MSHNKSWSQSRSLILGRSRTSGFLVPESESESGVINFLTLESESQKIQELEHPRAYE